MTNHDPNNYRDQHGNLTRDALTNFANDVYRSNQPLPQSVSNLSHDERTYIQNDYNYASSNRGW